MSGLGSGQAIHFLAPEVPYQIEITWDAADDVDAAIGHQSKLKPSQVKQFIIDLERAIERISVLPHLSRIHHGHLRVTVLVNHPYRLWYILDESTRTARIIGVIAVTHPSPPSGQIPGPLKRKWWLHMPYLPALLPQPYSMDTWAANPNWQEEDDQWWLSRIQPRTN